MVNAGLTDGSVNSVLTLFSGGAFETIINLPPTSADLIDPIDTDNRLSDGGQNSDLQGGEPAPSSPAGALSSEDEPAEADAPAGDESLEPAIQADDRPEMSLPTDKLSTPVERPVFSDSRTEVDRTPITIEIAMNSNAVIPASSVPAVEADVLSIVRDDAPTREEAAVAPAAPQAVDKLRVDVRLLGDLLGFAGSKSNSTAERERPELPTLF